MHEASIVEALVKLVVDSLPEENMRVSKIRLVVGEATGYMESSLKFYLGVLGKGTAVEGSELDIRYVKPLLKCSACGGEFERARFSFACPSCGGDGIMTKTGSEFFVDSIEVGSDGGHPDPLSRA
jgi:hydrogenase nickel incorporation protein HypA/HybF